MLLCGAHLQMFFKGVNFAKLFQAEVTLLSGNKNHKSIDISYFMFSIPSSYSFYSLREKLFRDSLKFSENEQAKTV